MPLENLTALIEFVDAARKFLSRRRGEIDHSLGDELSRALRTLYFPPDGILSFLLEIERGEPVDAARTQQALTAFNDREWQVYGALDMLEFRRLAKKLDLNLATVAALDRVRNEKSGLRRGIQDVINYYNQPGSWIAKQRVRELVSAIRALNDSIQQVEALVNSRARSH